MSQPEGGAANDQSWNNLSVKKKNNIVLAYNPKYKTNTYEPLLSQEND